MKRILLVGATSAIVVACARLWAADGAAFFLVGRNGERLKMVADDLRGRGAAEVAIHCMDMTDFAAHQGMAAAAFAALGQVDLVLVGHGSLPDQAECERNVDLALHHHVVNCSSVIGVLGWLAQSFERQGKGTIAVISSVAGDRGRGSNHVYGSAKAAVTVYCQGLRARMFRHGVKVVTIKPGFVDTPMTRGLPLPGPLVAAPEVVAARIVRGIAAGWDVFYAPGFWRWIMFAVRSVPESLFKRLKL
ncbi:SDR family oxidoreductase [Thauera sp. SDU_THAU2]|uniref:SDR family oxidoreductase n=1 Tax=Thauera sp. SDU_THAU2 TaxID=3136633 RepID=UPI00311D9E15